MALIIMETLKFMEVSWIVTETISRIPSIKISRWTLHQVPKLKFLESYLWKIIKLSETWQDGTSVPGDSVVLNKPDGYDAAFLKDYYSFFDPKDRVEPPPDPVEVPACAI